MVESLFHDEVYDEKNESKKTSKATKKTKGLIKAKKNQASQKIEKEGNKIVFPRKKWKHCDTSDDEEEKGFKSIIIAWGRERAFHLLGLFSLLMCAVLFSLQAYLAFRSYQIMHQLNTKPQIPEFLYQIYFDGYDWSLNLDKVDLRANTSLYIH